MQTRAILAAALALTAGAAAAQTTVCRDTYYGMPQLGMTCETTGQDKPTASGGGGTSGWSVVDRVLSGETITEARRNRRIAEDKERVAKLLGAGDCTEAVKVAAGTGDIAYARDVASFCRESDTPHR